MFSKKNTKSSQKASLTGMYICIILYFGPCNADSSLHVHKLGENIGCMGKGVVIKNYSFSIKMTTLGLVGRE